MIQPIQQEFASAPTVATTAHLKLLLDPAGDGPFVSIYIPTSRSDSEQNRIAFRTAMQQAETALDQLRNTRHNAGILQQLERLGANKGFWANQAEGLAVFASPDSMETLQLLQPIDDAIAIVADSYHIKPLLRQTQNEARFQLLSISRHQVALFEGDATGLTQVPLHPDVPSDMGEALGEPDHVAKTKRAVQNPEDSDQTDSQLKRYFRRVDQAVWDHHLNGSNLPLVLAALPEYHTLFRQASHHPRVSEHGVKRDPFKELSQSELHDLAWKAFGQEYENQTKVLRDRFNEAYAKDMASMNLEEIAKAVVTGRAETLMFTPNLQIGGSVDRNTGAIEKADIGDPHTDDLLDDLAEIALHRDTDVRIVNHDQMPNKAGVIAIFRYEKPEGA